MSQQLTLNSYQDEAQGFAKYATPDYPFIALSEEVGEVSGKLAKFGRKNHTPMSVSIALARDLNDQLKADLKKELGDVLWQLQACATELGVTLEDIAQGNLDKLSGRSERGTIVGEGDER